ncbi:hypothetical protein V8F33_000461 [Rhypophila sp. PSN 637]
MTDLVKGCFSFTILGFAFVAAISLFDLMVALITKFVSSIRTSRTILPYPPYFLIIFSPI